MTTEMTSTNEQAPSAPPSPQVAIDAVMNLSGEGRAEHPYWNEQHPDHKAEVDRLYMLRQAASATEPAPVAEKMDAFGRTANDQPLSGNYTTAALPQELETNRAQWSTLARDAGLGATEMSALLTSAHELARGETTTYTYDSGYKALTAKHGAKADQLLADAKSYLAEFPGVRPVLERMRAMNSPAAVEALADRYRARAAVLAELEALRRDPAFFGGTDHARSKQLSDKAFELTRRLVE